MHVYIVGKASTFLRELPPRDQEKVAATIAGLAEEDRLSLYIKTLRGPIRELRVGHYRVLFFKKRDVYYAVDGFRKKSQKTPRAHIEYAEKCFNSL